MASTVTIDLRHVARGLDFPLRQVQAVVELLDEGNTVPFITRYRKDQTGGLDEEQIREIQDRLAKMRLLAERKQTVLRSIEAQGKLTEKLAKQILGATTTKRLEDLYLPFKPKKQTLATLARSRGLEELATEILEAAPAALDLDARARDFANPDRQVPIGGDALLGAGHILAEQFSERADLRQRLREILQKSGKIVTTQIVPEPPAAAACADSAGCRRRPSRKRRLAETLTPDVEPDATDGEPEAEIPATLGCRSRPTPPAAVCTRCRCRRGERRLCREVEARDRAAGRAGEPEAVEPPSWRSRKRRCSETAQISAPTVRHGSRREADASGSLPNRRHRPGSGRRAPRPRPRTGEGREASEERGQETQDSRNAASRPSATTSITPKTSRKSRRIASWPSIAPSGQGSSA